MPDKPYRPPRDNLFRAVALGPEYRATDDAVGPPMLVGHFARFNEWNEIDSWIEGNFMERVAPGAFARTLKNKGSKMPVLFQHGRDPELGDKVIATPQVLREDEVGPYYEAEMLDGLPPLVMSGLRAGRYGASYRFRVLKEEFNPKPKRSTHNPNAIPERTIEEAEVFEFGPVTFPADTGATAGVRSLTDAYTAPDVIREMLRDPERVRELVELRPELIRNDPALASAIHDALPDDGLGDSHSDEGTRAEEPPEAPPVDPPQPAETTPTDPPDGGSFSVRENAKMKTIEEVRSRLAEIAGRFQEIHAEVGPNKLTDELQTEWDALVDERTILQEAEEGYESRMAVLDTVVREKPQNAEKVGQRDIVRGGTRTNVPANIYDVAEYRNLSSSDAEMKQAMRDGALRAVEAAVFPHERADADKNKAHIEKLLQKDEDGKLARHILATGNPVYARAFGKMLSGKAFLTAEEQRAIATVGSAQNADGGYAVQFTLDPTIILTSDGQVNPLREMARMETITGNTWKGVTSAGVTISRGAEEAAITPTSPTLAQPEVTVQSVKAEIQFSIESDEDWPRLQSEMARILQDAKDAEEAAAFVTGTGLTVNPEGIVAGLAATSLVGTTGDGLDLEDLDRLVVALPDRFEPRAQFLGHRAVFTEVERLDRATGGGSVYRPLAAGAPAGLLGYPRRFSSAMESDYTTDGNEILLFGDFQHFLIVDKIGLSLEIDPHVRNGDGKWTGQRAILAHYRNSSVILVDNAFRLLKVGVVTS